MASPTLALPAGDRPTERRELTAAVLLAGVAVISFFGALVAAYIGAKVDTARNEWRPEGFSPDNYLGTTLLITALMASVTVEWARAAARREERGQSIAAYGLSFLLALAFCNGVWYLGSEAGFGPADGQFALLFFALIGLAGVLGASAAGVVLLTFFRAVGTQLQPGRSEQPRVAAWYWHLVSLAWIAVYGAVFLYR